MEAFSTDSKSDRSILERRIFVQYPSPKRGDVRQTIGRLQTVSGNNNNNNNINNNKMTYLFGLGSRQEASGSWSLL